MLIAACATVAMSQDAGNNKVPFPLPEAAPKKDWEWDEDERFDELMEQLAINEASLDAIQASIDKKTRRKSGQLGEAKRQDDNTRMMDRKGGGPMKWDQFYGTNAEKFFYHPVDPNTTYRTDTFLRQIGKAEDDKFRPSGSEPSRQSLPVHQRPPQWDYIYKANETAKEKALADASLAEYEIERLEQRRTELEKEQAVLWCKLAFRAVQRLNVARKPLLRFELVSTTGNAGNTDQAKALSSAARFLAASLAVVEKAEQDQSIAFGGVASVVTQARESLEDSLLEVSDLESEWESTKTDLGKFYKLSQMLADKSKTLKESYAGAMDGDLNKEAVRKERFRGMLQESVVEYAQILLALNELADTMKTEWKVRVDTKKKVEPVSIPWAARADSRSGEEDPTLVDVDKGGKQRMTNVPSQKALRKAFATSKVTYDVKSGILSLTYDLARMDQLADWKSSETQQRKPGKGFRIAPADKLVHKALFVEGACTFAYEIRNAGDKGSVVSAGEGLLVSQGQFYTRVFRLCDKEVSFGSRDDTRFRVALTVQPERASLEVNNAEVAVQKSTVLPFHFTIYGGDNGADIGTVTISGKPDKEWFAEAIK